MKPKQTIPNTSLLETIVKIFQADPECNITLSWNKRFENIQLVMSDKKRSIITHITPNSPLDLTPEDDMAFCLRATFHNLKDDD